MIEIADDGAGINKRKVLEKAIAKNVVTRAESTKMTDAEILIYYLIRVSVPRIKYPIFLAEAWD